MEFLAALSQIPFIGSTIGLLIFTMGSYALAKLAKKIFPNAPSPETLAGMVFIVSLVTLPSMPRYRFESDVLSQLEGKDWFKIVKTTKLSALHEPLTWFFSPIGFFYVVGLDSPRGDTFRRVIFTYGEEPRYSLLEPNCSERTVLILLPNENDEYVDFGDTTFEMIDSQYESLCEYNWRSEKIALLNELKER